MYKTYMSQSLTSVAQRAARIQPMMLWQIFPIFVLAVAAIDHHHPGLSEYNIVVKHPLPYGLHDKLSHVKSHAPDHHNEYAWTYPSYEFSYHVDDPYTHDQKGQHEKRDGDEVKGMYWLIQPNDIKRMVRYHANKHTGFKADVEYIKPMYHYDHEKHEYLYKDKLHDKPVPAQHVVIYYDHKDEQKEKDEHIQKIHHEDEIIKEKIKEENDAAYHEHKYYVHDHKVPDQKLVMDYYEHKNIEDDKDHHHRYELDKKADEQHIFKKQHHALIDHEHKPHHHDDYGYYYGHKFE